MLPKATIAAVLGLSVSYSVLSVAPIIRIVSLLGHTKTDLLNVLSAAAFSLIPNGTLILFFLTFLWEISGPSRVQLRRSAAVLAATGQALQLSLSIWFAVRFLPYDPARYWTTTAISQLLPSLLWLFLLMIFSMELIPSTNRWARSVAAFLCLLTAINGIRAVFNVMEAIVGGASRGHLPEVVFTRSATALGWTSLLVLSFVLFKKASGQPQATG